jgi:hypothetical protein
MAASSMKAGDVVILETQAVKLNCRFTLRGGFPGNCRGACRAGPHRFGRWASDQGVNPLTTSWIRPWIADAGAPSFADTVSKLENSGRTVAGQHLGNREALGRKIALTVPIDQIGHEHGHEKPGLTMDSFPLTPPTPEGYDPKRDLYPPHDHDGYRWAMIVDMDRCIGCSACVAACYAENNIGIVGRGAYSGRPGDGLAADPALP